MEKSYVNGLNSPVETWVIEWKYKTHLYAAWGLPNWLSDKESACNAGDAGSIPMSGRSLIKEMAIHSSILAWEIT